MGYGYFTIRSDPFGFPMVRIDEMTYLSLFPVSKYQFERALSRQKILTRFTHTWYKKVLEVNGRCPWWDWGESPWRLFLTGMLPDEVADFLKLCGHGYRLPTVREWRALLKLAPGLKDESGLYLRAIKGAVSAKPPLHWAEKGPFPVVTEGLLEMLQEGEEHLAAGRPWQELQPNTWNPEETRRINWDVGRLGYLGFRLAWKSRVLSGRPV